MNKVHFAERVYWNARTYGGALRVRRNHIIAMLVGLCLLTMGTNWLIPFLHKFIRADFVIRY